jgi:RNA-binding protein
MTLNARQRKHLRGLAHALQPVVTVADNGLSRNVMAEIESALNHHELVKIRFRTERDTSTAWAEEVASRCGAERVQAIGQVVCFFRRNPRKPTITLPE